MQSNVDFVDSVSQFRVLISDNLLTLEKAQKQIADSANKSKKELDFHFSKLKSLINNSIDNRHSFLKSEIENAEKEELTILEKTTSAVNVKAVLVDNMLTEAKSSFSNGIIDKNQLTEKYKELYSHELPEIPSLDDVAHISLALPEITEVEFDAIMDEHGHVLKFVPLRIFNVMECPGGLIVNWYVNDDDYSFNEFRLQYMLNDSGDESSFKDLYQGSNYSYTLKNLKPCDVYVFRICGCGDNSQVWTPWARSQPAFTTMPAYEFLPCKDDYVVSNDNRYFEVTHDNKHGTILYSNGKLYHSGNSIVFKFLDCGKVLDDEGIALCINKCDNFYEPGVLLISSSGKVHTDGKEKSIKLPMFSRDSYLSIETEYLTDELIRVTVEISEKIITFDWKLPANDITSDNGGTNFYFGVRFGSQNWKISVE